MTFPWHYRAADKYDDDTMISYSTDYRVTPFVLVFRSHLQRLRISDSSKFRGHSFLRGGATWAFCSGVPGELIQVYGDWAPDAYKVYLEFSEDAKLRVARHMISAFDE